MSDPSLPPAPHVVTSGVTGSLPAQSTAGREPTSEATYTYLERHSVRVLVAGTLVTLNLLLLELARAIHPMNRIAPLLTLGLAVAMFLLLHRLSMRTTRFAIFSARQQSRLSYTLLAATERILAEPAGTEGTAEALAATAADVGCEVLLWEEPSRTLVAPDTGTRWRLTPTVARRLVDALEARRPVLFADARVAGILPSALATDGGTRSLAITPMWAGDDLLGIVLQRHGSVRALRAALGPSISAAIAALGAVALGKAIVVDREQRHARENELLLRSVQIAAAGADVDSMNDHAVQAADTIGCARAAIWSVAGGHLRLVGTYGVARTSVLGARPLPLRTRFIDRVRNSGHEAALHLVDDSVDTVASATFAQLGFGVRVCVQPVHDSKGMSGIVVIDMSATGSTLDDRSTRLLSAVSRQVGMAIERRLMWRSMRKRSRQLECTPQLARDLSGVRERSVIARIAARRLHDGFGFGRVSIALVEPDIDRLQLQASSGMLAQTSTPIDSTPVLDAVRASRAPYVSFVGESSADAPPRCIDDENAPFGCRSQLVVPILDGQRECIGVIAVYERDTDALGEDDMHVLETVADQLSGTLEQAGLIETLERSYFKTVEALSAALEAKDAYTLDHARSITEASAEVGRLLGMGEDEIRDLKLGALLHDIGKIGVPNHILNKEGALTDEEFEVMKEHTIIGEQIIAPIEFLQGVRPMVLHEHERWDGAGYPHQLEGEQIPLGARIIFVCDAWHAMTSDRPYRKSLPQAEAKRRLRAGSGTQFDPRVVAAFLDVLESGRVSELVPLP